MTFVGNFVNNLYRGASFSFKFDNFSRNSIRFVQKWCKTVSKSISAQCPLVRGVIFTIHCCVVLRLNFKVMFNFVIIANLPSCKNLCTRIATED